ncbi:MAG: pilus assembly protein [Rickettsiales bacterium]|nr:pilus assembly protein [Rickettsiales bacterium]
MKKALSLRKNTVGAVAIEFAIILPLLLLMTLPIYDFFRYIMIIQKMNKTISTIADMIVLSEPAPAGTVNGDPVINSNPFILTQDRLRNIVTTADFLMQPYSFSRTNGQGNPSQFINVVSIYNPPGTGAGNGPGIYWSYTNFGLTQAIDPRCNATEAHGSFCGRENLNPTNDPANTEGTFIDQMADGENAVIVRICYDFEPILQWNNFILPILNIPMFGVTSRVGAAACDASQLQFVRYFPARNGPLLQVYN